jgi:transcriptional regulator with XRE-family HTH domain
MKANNYEYLLSMGRRVRMMRLSKNITLTELARRTGLQTSCISNLETKGKNSYLLTLKTIADVLEVDVKDFL